MALFNEILVGRLNRWVQKIYAIKSGTASLTQLLPTVQTSAVIQEGVESRYLQGWTRFSVSNNAPAVAAQFTEFQIRNPIGSGVVAVIEDVNILVGANMICLITVEALSSTLGTVPALTRVSLDARHNPNPSCIVSFGSQNAVPGFNNSMYQLFAQTAANAQMIRTANQEWTVLPGDAFILIGALVNTAMSPSIIWRERPLESSELT